MARLFPAHKTVMAAEYLVVVAALTVFTSLVFWCLYRYSVMNWNSPEAAVFRRHYTELKAAIQSPGFVADELFARGSIDFNIKEKVHLPTRTTTENTEILLHAIGKKVSVDPDEFYKLIDVLQKEPATKKVAKRLLRLCQNPSVKTAVGSIDKGSNTVISCVAAVGVTLLLLSVVDVWKLELGLAPYFITVAVGALTLAVISYWVALRSMQDTKYRNLASFQHSRVYPKKDKNVTDIFSLPQYTQVMVSNYRLLQPIFAITEYEQHTREINADEQFSPIVTIVDTATQQPLDCMLLLCGEKPPEVNCRTLFYIAVQVICLSHQADLCESLQHPLYHVESKPCKKGKLPLMFCFYQSGMVCVIQLSVNSIADSEGVEYMHHSENCTCVVQVLDQEHFESSYHSEKTQESTDSMGTFNPPQCIRVIVSNYQLLQTIFAIAKGECHTRELRPDEQFSPIVTIADAATQQTLDCVLLLHGEKPPEVNYRTLFCYIAVQVTVVPYYGTHNSHPHTLYHMESKLCENSKLQLIFCFYQPRTVWVIQLSVKSITDSKGVEFNKHHSEDCTCIVKVVDQEQHRCYHRGADLEIQGEIQPAELPAQEDEVKWEVGEIPHPETKKTEEFETAVEEEKGTKDVEEPKPKPLSACTPVGMCFPDVGVDLNIGECSIEAMKPITVGQLFKDAVERFPMHPALKYKEDGIWKTITYNGYYDLCIKAAKSFLKLGLEPHHAVAIIGFNSPQWLISNLGAMFAGGLPTGIYATNKPEACHFVANNCRANVIVVENQKQLDKVLKIRDCLPHMKAIVQFKGKLGQKYPNVYEWEEFLNLGDAIETSVLEEKIRTQKPNQFALLIYTSGTTGKPKGVVLSHDNLTFAARALEKTHGHLEYGQDRVVSYLPLSHIAAQMTDIYLPLLVGATVYFAQPDALNGSLRQTLQEVQPTFFFGVPRVYENIMERLQEHGSSISGLRKSITTWAKNKGLEGNRNRQDNRSLPRSWTIAEMLVFKKVRQALGFQHCKMFVVGAAPMRREVHDYFMSINIPLMELYGMSESSGPHTLNLMQPDRWKVGSCGKTIEGVQLKIFNPDENGEGEICIFGRHVFMGYLNDEEKTSEAIDDDRWLHSGDIGKVQDGFLYITGRIKELIITSSGEKIPPVPIESMIKKEIPFLSNVMIIGDQRKFLTCLMTLKCEIHPDTGEPLDTLPPKVQQQIHTLGSYNTKVSEIVHHKDRAIFTAIWEGVNRANKQAASQAQRVQKWTLLNSDFSIPGGELGPTLKVRRSVVHEKYATIIEDMYRDSQKIQCPSVHKMYKDMCCKTRVTHV